MVQPAFVQLLVGLGASVSRVLPCLLPWSQETWLPLHVAILSDLAVGSHLKQCSRLIWGRCNLKHSRRSVIFLPVYKISSLTVTPPKTLNSWQFSYLLPNIVSFLFDKSGLEFWFRSHDFSFKLFPVCQPYCW